MRLIPGVEAMAIRFYSKGQWKTEWDARQSGLPDMVEVELKLRSTNGREPVRFISAFEVPDVEPR
jgi:type II secretion system protein J